MLSQKGFSHIIVIIAVLVAAVIGVAGWRVYDANNSSQDTSDQQVSVQQNGDNGAIETSADVAAAEAELGSINVDDDLDPNALDDDISGLQ